MIRYLYIAMLLFSISTLSQAKMFKCIIDGKTTYSQTRCIRDYVEFKSYDSDKLHREAIRRRKFQNKDMQSNFLKREIDLNYERVSNNILRRIRSINLGTNQTLSQLVRNKKRKRLLEKEFKVLNIDYLNIIDPAGRSQREIINVKIRC